MLWQGVSKALRTPAKCICTIRPSTHLIENLREEREGAGKRKEKKYCFMGLFLKRKKKEGKEKGITYSCFYGLSFNSIPVTLNTSQNGSDWSSITDGLSIGSQGAGGVQPLAPVISRASLRLPIILWKKLVRVVHWSCVEGINISVCLSLPTSMVIYIISFPTIETQLHLG